MWSVSLEVLSAIGAAALTLISFTWWFSGQFSKVRQQIYESGERIMSKLEYHEQHDDTRFNALNNELWAIKLRNATADDFAKRLLVDVAEIKNGHKKETKDK